jgi:putative DNA primase/helicase
MPVKNNLAPLGNGLAFRLEQQIVADGIVASRIAWDSNPIKGTVDSVLAESNDTGAEKSAKTEAADFLGDLLANGPMPSKEVKEHAEAAGFSWATIKRAKKCTGIEHYREGGMAAAGHWLWRLPNTPICLTGSQKAYLAHALEVGQLGEFEPVSGSGGGR